MEKPYVCGDGSVCWECSVSGEPAVSDASLAPLSVSSLMDMLGLDITRQPFYFRF